MEFELANRKRDRRLRKLLLLTLRAAIVSPKGGLSGRRLVDEVGGDLPDGDGFEDDTHALGLLRELAGKGYVEEADARTRRTQRFGLEYLHYKIAERGIALLNESIAVDPDIDDERNLDD